MAIDALNHGYKIADMCRKYKIPRSSLKDHYEKRTKNRKMDLKIILNKDNEEKLVEGVFMIVGAISCVASVFFMESLL